VIWASLVNVNLVRKSSNFLLHDVILGMKNGVLVSWFLIPSTVSEVEA
jgi:hypothetical protein